MLYYPFGITFAESTSVDAQPYKYNGKELDKMHGLNLHDYSARYYESVIGRFTTVDPHAEKYFSWSPYVYVMNNPLKYIDPTGMDSVIVNGKGIATGVYKNDGTNRFFDSEGNELSLHDPEGVDNLHLTQLFEKDDQIYYPLSEKDVISDIYKNPLLGLGINLFNSTGLADILTALASYSGADFTHSFLAPHVRKKGIANYATLQIGNRSTYVEPNGIYFRIGKSNTMYNLYDAGNFMWGAWGCAVGHPYSRLKAGSQANELWQDSEADQRAIKNGYKWMEPIIRSKVKK